MQVATTAPQTSSGLLAVGPAMAKVLAVVALRKARLRSVNSTVMIILLFVPAILVYLAVT
jgi:hypothetical protein